MKHIKYIQLFTRRPEKYEDNLEVDGELLDIKFGPGYVNIKTKEVGFKDIWEHYFPLDNVDMIRISHKKRTK